MEHMVARLMVGTGRIEITRLEMEGSWIHLVDEAMDMEFTLVLVQTTTMVIISIILTGGVIGDICWMSSRNQSHLHFMEK